MKFILKCIISLDKGSAMIHCMNCSGIDYVCMGNHESDIVLPMLHQRILQSSFTWVNSNMPDLPLPESISKLPEYVIIEVKSDDNSNIKKIALLGLCTEDRSVMKPNSFGNCTILPIAERIQELSIMLQVLAHPSQHNVNATPNKCCSVTSTLTALYP